VVKGEKANLGSIVKPAYSYDKLNFRTLIETIALATVSQFKYDAPNEDIIKLLAKRLKKNPKSLPKSENEIGVDDLIMKTEWIVCKTLLTQIEEKKPYMKRTVEGDASETGLVKFIQPLLMGGEYGCYDAAGLDGFRAKHPIMINKNGDK